MIDRAERQWHETVLHLNAILDRLGPRADQLGIGERDIIALRELRTRIHRGYHLPDTTPDDLNDDVDQMVEFLRLLEQSSLGPPGSHAIRRRSSPEAVADILVRSDAGNDSSPSGPKADAVETLLAQSIVAAMPPSLTGPQEHLVLQALAEHPDTEVPATTLARAVWGSRPPLTWRAVLADHVTRLRQHLNDLAEHGLRSSIEATSEGFRLAIGGEPPLRLWEDEARPGATRRALDFTNLTSRERQVLAKVVEGHTTREIATQLHLSARTVSSYIKRIERKLGVRPAEATDTTNRIPRF
ncbi:hypothetical protein DMH01_15480 [Amycolatopsis sp. WAC 04182]|uniref:helix-turn-helix transcriptional regulator n=1 Tax=Amycolatopsis sp. WAC 04182 TaxID=2203198 RepID=UPI000F7B5E1E|nr:helix-turn-helix transcriptional regulator [Amycolatopsis sp. WAC 04182]RSN60682.1 hypothetical protein DMH01_15480 [Amycolatopsis sp. WAC 04182]